MTNETFNIEALPVKIDYVCETVRDNAWACDQWRVTISNNLGCWSTDYFTGLGHRTKPKQSWAKPMPKKPSIADVLYSLFLDADAADYNFSDWCDMFGCSDDSIKALNVYRQCLETATNLRRYFTPEQRESIKTIIQEM
jgi:hypothetical protein